MVADGTVDQSVGTVLLTTACITEAQSFVPELLTLVHTVNQ